MGVGKWRNHFDTLVRDVKNETGKKKNSEERNWWERNTQEIGLGFILAKSITNKPRELKFTLKPDILLQLELKWYLFWQGKGGFLQDFYRKPRARNSLI